MTRYLLIAVVVLLLLWGRTAFYAVDQAEFVYVTRFGDPIAIHDGATDAGLHVKLPWPIDSVQRIDRRVQSFDLPAVESLTRDPGHRHRRQDARGRRIRDLEDSGRRRRRPVLPHGPHPGTGEEDTRPARQRPARRGHQHAYRSTT